MNKFLIFIIIIAIPHCSFDNKSGIWQSNSHEAKKNEKFKSYKTLNIEKKLFDEIIEPEKNLQINLQSIKKNLVWLNKNYNNSNKLDNFSYKNL